MKKFMSFISVVFIMMLVAVPVAFGQDIPDLGEDPSGFFAMLWEKLQSSEWLAVFGMGLVGVVEFLKRGLPWLAGMLGWDSVKAFLASKKGHYAIAFSMAFLLAVGTPFAAGAGFEWSMLGVAIAAAFAAAGGWDAVKDLFGMGSSEEAPSDPA